MLSIYALRCAVGKGKTGTVAYGDKVALPRHCKTFRIYSGSGGKRDPLRDSRDMDIGFQNNPCDAAVYDSRKKANCNGVHYSAMWLLLRFLFFR
jgi:hypothetical protein